MNKSEAIKRLDAIEKEAQALRKIIEAPLSIMDRVKSYDDACVVLGIRPGYNIHELDSKDVVAYKKLKVIAKALNEGWEPDYTNSSQEKWYPLLKYVAGSGFSFFVSVSVGTASYVGARLTFKSKELATYAGKQFIDLYNDLLT